MADTAPNKNASTDGAVVVEAGADVQFHFGASSQDVASVGIVDTDIVLTLKSGAKVLLVEGAIDATRFPNATVQFSDRMEPLQELLHHVGQVQVAAGENGVRSEVAQPQTDQHQVQDTQNAGASPQPIGNNLAQLVSAGASDQISAAIPPTVIHPSDALGMYLAPPAFASPPSPANPVGLINSNSILSISVLGETGSSTANGVLYGGYGGPNVNTDSSAIVQMAVDTISGVTANSVIIANQGNGETFTKVLHISYSGSATPSTLVISGVPSGVTLLNATSLGNGEYSIDLTAAASKLGGVSYDIPIQYTLSAADASNSIHSQFSLTTMLTGTLTGHSVTTSVINVIVVKDASTASDLAYVDPQTGTSALVFPAQGISYQITAVGGDTITGGANNDTIFSGVGSNVLNGADGTNTLSYQNSAVGETINLRAGTAVSTVGSDSISNFQVVVGSSGNDSILAAANTVSISGGPGGNDTFDGSGAGTSAAPLMITGSATGSNTLTFASDMVAGVTVDGSKGVASGDGYQVFSNIETIVGSALSDSIVASPTTMFISAGSGGNDTLDGGGAGNASGAITIHGSDTGINTLTFAQDTVGGVAVDLGTGQVSGGYGIEQVSNIQKVVGSSFSDSLVGTTTTLSLDGGSGGSDTFAPGGGGTLATPETITGGGINNTVSYDGDSNGVIVDLRSGTASGDGQQVLINIQNVIGSAGNDSITGTSISTLLTGGTGGNDTFDGGGGNVTIIGSSGGNNTLTFANDVAGGVTVDLNAGLVTGAYGNESISNVQNVIGSAFSDSMTAGANTLSLSGGIGGDDTFSPNGAGTSNAALSITGAVGGTNVVTYADASGPVAVNLTTGVATGSGVQALANIQEVIGSAGSDSLKGAVTSLFLSGGSGGDDTFDGGGGGSAVAPLTIVGGAGGNNTLTFAGDLLAGVTVNLGSGSVTGGYGVEQVSFIENVIGSAASDNLTGTTTTLSLSGGGGNDTFNSGGGGTSSAAETITGSIGGNNTLTYAGTTAAIVVNLGTGVGSGSGTQSIFNIENLIGGSGNDSLTGAMTTLSLSGGGGNDTFNPGGGGTSSVAETITGSIGGNNTVTYASATGPVTVDLGAGTASGFGIQTLNNIQNVIGSTSNDSLTGATTTLSLSGGGGNDTFNPGGGGTSSMPETITGSIGGNNTLTYAGATAAVVVNLGTGVGTGSGTQSIFNIENLIGGSGNDSLTGSTTTRSLSGGAGGNDTFNPGGGGTSSVAETILGSVSGNNTVTYVSATGPVTVNLGAGTASGFGIQALNNIKNVVGSTSNDSLTGATTTLSLVGGGGNDTFNPGGGGTSSAAETISGSVGGNNTLTYAGTTAAVVVNLGTGVGTGSGTQSISNIQNLIGGSGNDSLTGSTTTRSLSGGAGGNDTFNPGGGGTSSVAETISGSVSGNNTVTYVSATGPVTVNLGAGTASGFGIQALNNIKNVVGSTSNDSLTGATTTLSLVGGGGNDTFNPGGGGTSSAAETISGSVGGNNTLTYAGTTAAVVVNLGTGVGTGSGTQSISNIQNLIGGSGNDSLTGSTTTRSLSGGAGGNDTFNPGGGGTASAPEVITGGLGGMNTVTFAASTGPVSVNFLTNIATGFGNQTFNNIQNVIGSASSDSLVGNSITLSLSGGSGGNDTFNPGGGGTVMVPESILGSATGNNSLTYAGAPAGVTVNLATNSGTGYGTQFIQNIQNLIGGSGSDNLTGSVSTKSISGGAGGNDTFNPGGGGTSAAPETITGGVGGNNTVTYDGATAAVTVNMITNVATGYGTQTLSGIQNVIGSAFSDSLIAGSSTRSLNGGTGGNDTFNGSGFGTSAAPLTITGSAGGSSNTLLFSGAKGGVNVNLAMGSVTGAYGVEAISRIQYVVGSTFADTLTGASSGNATIDPNGGADSIVGGSGFNTLTYANAGTGGVILNLTTGRETGYGAGTETITGVITGVIGSAGSDSITAGVGVKTLSGGSGGNDTFDGAGISGITITGSGTGTANTLTFAAATGAVNVNLAAGTVSGAYGTETISAIQKVIGSSFGDVITGVATGSATIDPNGGADSLVGGAGSNTLTYANAGTGGVVVNFATGHETGYGSGIETISGRFTGVIGSAGSDSFVAAVGITSMSGGSGGNDTFDGGGVSNLTITGSTTGTNTLTFANSPGAVSVNLAAGTVTGAYGTESVSHIQNVIGSSGSDLLIGSSSTVSLSGGTGGNDTFDGGGGGTSSAPLTISGSSASSSINTLTFANDTVSGVSVNLATGAISGGYGVESVTNIQKVIGSSFADSLVGSSTTLMLSGGSGGNDTFDGGHAGTSSAPLTIVGSSTGFNTLTFAHSTGSGAAGAVMVDLLHGSVTGAYGFEMISGIRGVIGSANGNDVITANNLGDSIVAGNGNVSIIGGSGGDTIIGGTGTDTIMGGSGADLITTKAGIVNIIGGAGNDTIDASLATGGLITGGSAHTATMADSITAGPAFVTAMQADSTNNHINPGAGTNSLALNWSTGSQSTFDFGSVSNAIQNVSTIDLSHNSSPAGITYTISAAEIQAMTPAASLNVKLASNDSLFVQLAAGQTTSFQPTTNTEFIKNASAVTLATIHFT